VRGDDDTGSRGDIGGLGVTGLDMGISLNSGGGRGWDIGNAALSRCRRRFAQHDHRKIPRPKGRMKNTTEAATMTGTCQELLPAVCALGIVVIEGVDEAAILTELMVVGTRLPSVTTGPR